MTAVAAGFWDTHGSHALLLAGPMVLLAAVAVGSDLRAWLRATGRRPGASTLVAAGSSLVAAAVHGAVCPEHFGEAALYGVFFLAAAAAQVGWATLVLVRPRRWVLTAGLAGNIAVLLLWATTRTVGLPFGPEAGEVEAVGSLDLVAAVCELGVVIGCGLALLRRRDVATAPALAA